MGTLAPNGAVLKHTAACDPRFHVHEGPAIVFDSYPEMKAFVDDPASPVTADHVMVLRNAGPLGGPGMPEWGMLPLPIGAGAGRGTATCCGCRTRACRARATAPACCTSRPRPSSAGRWRCSATGDIVALRRAEPAHRHAGQRERDRATAAPPGARPRRASSAATAGPSRGTSGQADAGCDFDYLAPEFGRTAGEPDIF